ncbi:Mbov_0401 family ICE element transposase-like protein [Mesomycoplasma ovipneumoniae]|uniref:Mbov_0401 family ICE element transposase-like protein n=1 Tax=Mesomycoplasma ovipneumoniae TaxID=29562 RepID=UPI00311C91DD
MNKFYNPAFYNSEEKSILLENLVRKIEEEDKKFLEKINQIKDQGLHSKIKRKLKTEYGKIQVEVNRYWKKVSIGDENGEVIGQKKVIFYSDFFKELVQKGKTITNSLIEKIIGLCFEVKYGSSLSRIFSKVISVGSVNLILKRLNVDNEIYNFKTLASNQSYINLAVDDSFHRVVENRKTYKVKNRMLVLYLGKRNGKVYGKTNILQVRKIGNRTQNIYELAAKIKEIILQIYGKKLDIVVYGDGAPWIKTLSKHLGAIYILDKFHLLKKLSDLVSLKNNNSLNHFLFAQKYPKLYQKLLNYFEKKQSNDVVLELRQIMKYLKIESEKHVLLFSKISQKIEEVGEFLRYVISNMEAINQLFSFKSASSCTEGFVASLVKFNIKIKYSSFSFDRYFNNLKLNHLYKNTNLILI